MFEMVHISPSPCCLFRVKERHPGEQFEARQTWPFVFHQLRWQAQR